MGSLSITGGTLRSRHVRVPRGRTVRPTAARAKEALFSILQPRLSGARVLDLFAGTGSLGFEALSRGAAFVTFVEIDRVVAAQLRDTARELGVAERAEILLGDVNRATVRLRDHYDLVFADPPYAQPPPTAAFDALATSGRIDDGSHIVYEHSARATAPTFARLILRRTERYGETAFAFYQKAAQCSSHTASPAVDWW